MVVSFYVRIIVYVGITLPAIPSVRIAKSRQFSMDAMNKERGAALTCREGDEEKRPEGRFLSFLSPCGHDYFFTP